MKQLMMAFILAGLPVSVVLAAPAAPVAALVSAKGDVAKGREIANTLCGACHGADGNSTAAEYPSLAGQPPEYINKQLRNFKSGARKDPIMAPMVVALSTADMLNVAAYLSAQTLRPRVAKDVMRVEEGKRIYKGGNVASGIPACASCHGPAGEGVPVQFPRLAGQHAQYLQSQLTGFRNGDRTNDSGKMMQAIARKMTDREMHAVSMYISNLR